MALSCLLAGRVNHMPWSREQRSHTGEWLCFMDADTFAMPELLWSTYRLAIQYQADMFSILTDQELGSFWERTILPLVFLGLSFGFPAERVNDPS